MKPIQLSLGIPQTTRRSGSASAQCLLQLEAETDQGLRPMINRDYMCDPQLSRALARGGQVHRIRLIKGERHLSLGGKVFFCDGCA